MVSKVHHYYDAGVLGGVRPRAEAVVADVAYNVTVNCLNRTYIPKDPLLDPCNSGKSVARTKVEFLFHLTFFSKILSTMVDGFFVRAVPRRCFS